MNLSKGFILTLTRLYPHKKELVSLLSEILKIEKESAYRRLNGKVQFTIDEIALLAKKLDISLDNLIYSENNRLHAVFEIEYVNDINSMYLLEEHIRKSIEMQSLIKGNELSVGIVLDTLPIEWYASHPTLQKFMYYRWGRINSTNVNYEDFSHWKIPEGLVDMQNKYLKNFERYKRVTYIIDHIFLSNLIDEIKYYKSIRVLSEEDCQLLKNELLNLFSIIELFLKTKTFPPFAEKQYEVYLAYFTIALAVFYVLVDNEYYSGIKASFLNSTISHDYDSGRKIHLWIENLKNISTLISGAGEKERIRFIDESRRCIELM